MNKDHNIVDSFFEGLKDVPPSDDIEILKKELKEMGINSEDTLSKIKKIISENARSSWKEQAAINKADMMGCLNKVTNWLSKPAHEIEAAYSALPQDVAFAFRNKKNLSLQDKAKILESQDLLNSRLKD